MDDRYSRQILVEGMGQEGLAKLSAAKVLVIGAGGLGSVLLLSLAGAGVGQLSFADNDVVSQSNLNRQFLYNSNEIGKSKTEIAAIKLKALNPNVEVIPFDFRVDESNIATLLTDKDLVILAVDNLDTRLLVGREAYLRKIPLIDGGINGWVGTLCAFTSQEGPCLNCLYGGPRAKKATNPPGSLGGVVSAISSLEATLATILLVGQANPLDGKILYMDALKMQFETIPLPVLPNCPVCGKK